MNRDISTLRIRFFKIGTMGVAFSLGLVAGSLAAFSAPPKPVHYKVSGSTFDELIASLNASLFGGWGFTKFEWKQSWTSVSDGSHWTIKTANVSESVTINMPSWTGYDAASTCMKRSWDAMYESLLSHEHKHVDLAKKMPERLKNAIKAVQPQPTEDELNVAARTAAQTLIDENKTKQDDFDTKTSHGKQDPVDPVIIKSCP